MLPSTDKGLQPQEGRSKFKDTGPQAVEPRLQPQPHGVIPPMRDHSYSSRGISSACKELGSGHFILITNESLNKLKNQPVFLDLQDRGGQRTSGCPTAGGQMGSHRETPCQGRVARLTTDSAAAFETAWCWRMWANGSVEQNRPQTETHISAGPDI